MFHFKIFSIFSILFILFLFNSCNIDFGTNSNGTEIFSFEYNESGGIAGINNTLTISMGDSIVYLSHDYNLSTKAIDEELNSLFDMLRRNSFFSMGTAYLPDQHIADDIFFRISYNSYSKSKIIIASGFCSNSKLPKGLIRILDYLQDYIMGLNYSGKIIFG